MKHMVTQLLFAAALALGSATAAQAFTFEGTAPGDGAGVQRNYADPDDQLQSKAGNPQRFNSGGQGDSQTEGFSLQFGGRGQSFDQKYNSSDFFNPLRR
jgi:hypothetical protein